MSSVDERIVEMRFDNAQFESGAKTSIGTLGKLQSALKLGDAGKSLSNIGESVKGIDTRGLASGLEIISNRFSVLGIMGDQVIRRLTDGFMQLGHSVTSAVKGLTIDQIGAGFTKYVYRNFGYTLGTIASAQTTVGIDVTSMTDLKVGDLILFQNEEKTKIGHTGVYLGNGEFIHAANPDRGVVIDNLNTSTYYNTRFVIAKRIV